jgi:hypothetical protein
LEQFNITEEDIFQSEDKGSVSAEVEDFFNFLPTATVPVKGSENLSDEEKKAKVLEGKALNKENSERYDETFSAYINLSFSNADAKVAFCERFGLDATENVADGEKVMAQLDI